MNPYKRIKDVVEHEFENVSCMEDLEHPGFVKIDLTAYINLQEIENKSNREIVDLIICRMEQIDCI